MDSPYFDGTYFDPSYFDTDADGGTEGFIGRGGKGRKRRPNVMTIDKPQVDDEDWITLIL